MGLFYQRKNDFGDAKGKTAQFTDFLNLLGGNKPETGNENDADSKEQDNNTNKEKKE